MEVGDINGCSSTMQCSEPERKIYSEIDTLKPKTSSIPVKINCSKTRFLFCNTIRFNDFKHTFYTYLNYVLLLQILSNMLSTING